MGEDVKYAKVVISFSGPASSSSKWLSLSLGEVIEILNDQGSNYQGRKLGSDIIGLFPSKCVEISSNSQVISQEEVVEIQRGRGISPSPPGLIVKSKSERPAQHFTSKSPENRKQLTPRPPGTTPPALNRAKSTPISASGLAKFETDPTINAVGLVSISNNSVSSIGNPNTTIISSNNNNSSSSSNNNNNNNNGESLSSSEILFDELGFSLHDSRLNRDEILEENRAAILRSNSGEKQVSPVGTVVGMFKRKGSSLKKPEPLSSPVNSTTTTDPTLTNNNHNTPISSNTSSHVSTNNNLPIPSSLGMTILPSTNSSTNNSTIHNSSNQDATTSTVKKESSVSTSIPKSRTLVEKEMQWKQWESFLNSNGYSLQDIPISDLERWKRGDGGMDERYRSDSYDSESTATTSDQRLSKSAKAATLPSPTSKDKQGDAKSNHRRSLSLSSPFLPAKKSIANEAEEIGGSMLDLPVSRKPSNLPVRSVQSYSISSNNGTPTNVLDGENNLDLSSAKPITRSRFSLFKRTPATPHVQTAAQNSTTEKNSSRPIAIEKTKSVSHEPTSPPIASSPAGVTSSSFSLRRMNSDGTTSSSSIPNKSRISTNFKAFGSRLLGSSSSSTSSGSGKNSSLTNLIRHYGIPPSYRSELWFRCSGAYTKMKYATAKESYAEVVKLSEEFPPVEYTAAIERDLKRTFPTNHHFHEDSSGLLSLRRVLLAYSLRNPVVGYAQSMNFLTAMLLLHMEEERAFWVLAAIVEDLLPGYFAKDMLGLLIDQKVFETLVEMKLPQVTAHLQTLELPLLPISCQWFLSVFVNSLPLATTLRIWDCFMHEGSKALFRIGITILKIMKKQILAAKTFQDAYCVLSELNEAKKSSVIMAASKIMKHAYDPLWFGAFPFSLIQDLRNTHRESCIKHVQDRGTWSTGANQAKRLSKERVAPIIAAGDSSNEKTSTQKVIVATTTTTTTTTTASTTTNSNTVVLTNSPNEDNNNYGPMIFGLRDSDSLQDSPSTPKADVSSFALSSSSSPPSSYVNDSHSTGRSPIKSLTRKMSSNSPTKARRTSTETIVDDDVTDLPFQDRLSSFTFILNARPLEDNDEHGSL